jgi:integrase
VLITMATIERYTASDSSARYRVRYRGPGRRQTDKRGFRTKRAAEQFAATVEVQKRDGTYVAPSAGRIPVGEWVRRWLSDRSDLRPTTRERYDGIVRTHIMPRWETVLLSAVSHADVQHWVSELTASGLSPASVRKCHRVLSLALDLAMKERLIVTNPAHGVKIARPTVSPRRYLTHRQVRALADAAGPVGKPVIYVLAYCGLRWGEMAAVRVSDVDLARRRIAVTSAVTEVQGHLVWGGTKTRQRRTVPIPAFMTPIITASVDGKDSDDLAFTAAGGGVLRYRVARASWFDAAVKQAGCPEGFHPHELRHTAASLAISAGANVKAVQRMLGHASAAMTLDTYADLFADDLEDVAMRLDRAASLDSVGKMWANDHDLEEQDHR